MTEQKSDVMCICTKCKKLQIIDNFMKDGKQLKTCQRCREMSRKNREKNKCSHGREKNRCKECGGGSICEHNRQRSTCKECGGGSICEHNRIRSRCKDCNGSQICDHGRLRSQCKECNGGSICEHSRIRSQCKECNGGSICEHNRRKSQCKECNGGSICEHSRIRSYCKECMDDEQKIEYIKKQMIHHSKHQDNKKDRYDDDKFIDMEFLTELFDSSNTCHYCSVEFTYNELCNTLVTIERLNNTIGHIKSNCVLACWRCNNKHQGVNDIRE